MPLVSAFAKAGGQEGVRQTRGGLQAEPLYYCTCSLMALRKLACQLGAPGLPERRCLHLAPACKEDRQCYCMRASWSSWVAGCCTRPTRLPYLAEGLLHAASCLLLPPLGHWWGHPSRAPWARAADARRAQPVTAPQARKEDAMRTHSSSAGLTPAKSSKGVDLQPCSHSCGNVTDAKKHNSVRLLDRR